MVLRSRPARCWSHSIWADDVSDCRGSCQALGCCQALTRVCCHALGCCQDFTRGSCQALTRGRCQSLNRGCCQAITKGCCQALTRGSCQALTRGCCQSLNRGWLLSSCKGRYTSIFSRCRKRPFPLCIPEISPHLTTLCSSLSSRAAGERNQLIYLK